MFLNQHFCEKCLEIQTCTGLTWRYPLYEVKHDLNKSVLFLIQHLLTIDKMRNCFITGNKQRKSENIQTIHKLYVQYNVTATHSSETKTRESLHD